MKPETRLQRHAQLWEAGTASVRRVAIGGSIFAVLILLRVVEPYHSIDVQEGLLHSLKTDEAKIEEASDQLQETKSALNRIRDKIRQQPWVAEKDQLIRYFEQRQRGEGSVEIDPETRANETIENIAKQVRENVADPLRAILAAGPHSERLASFPGKIDEAITAWVAEHHDNSDWYYSRESKERTVSGMKDVLESLETEALEAVSESETELEKIHTSNEAELRLVQSEIAETSENLQDELDDILPSWARDSLTFRGVNALYPWLLVAIATVLVGKGIIAARHFHGMADEEGWTQAERSDPLLSSPWTLTWRGLAGTGVTVLYYVAVIAALTLCLFRAMNPLTTTTDLTAGASSDMVAHAISARLPNELAYGFLFLAMVLVCIAALRARPA